MTQRINKASQKRIDKALNANYTMRQGKDNNGSECRTEALSTIKRIKLVRG